MLKGNYSFRPHGHNGLKTLRTSGNSNGKNCLTSQTNNSIYATLNHSNEGHYGRSRRLRNASTSSHIGRGSRNLTTAICCSTIRSMNGCCSRRRRR